MIDQENVKYLPLPEEPKQEVLFNQKIGYAGLMISLLLLGSGFVLDDIFYKTSGAILTLFWFAWLGGVAIRYSKSEIEVYSVAGFRMRKFKLDDAKVELENNRIKVNAQVVYHISANLDRADYQSMIKFYFP